MPELRTIAVETASDAELIRLVLRKDEAAARALMQRYNRRLYRVARGVVRDDGEAEDVLQEAYLRAFSALADFRGESSLSTWLTRIVLNEALQRCLAAFLRVFGVGIGPAHYLEVLQVAGLAWMAAFGLFVVVYTPILVTPRVGASTAR